MQEFGLNGSTLVAVGRTVALLRDTLTLDNCVRALETAAVQLRNLTIFMPHGGLGELILDGSVNISLDFSVVLRATLGAQVCQWCQQP
jgi:hypothetical protein